MQPCSTTVKKYLNLYFFQSLHQLMMDSARTTEHSQMLVDNILTNLQKKAMHSDNIKRRLFVYELINRSQNRDF